MKNRECQWEREGEKACDKVGVRKRESVRERKECVCEKYESVSKRERAYLIVCVREKREHM